MLRHFGSISEAFELPDRGCIVHDSDIAPGIELHIGDEVAVLSGDADPIRTRVKGLELGHQTRVGVIGVLLGPEVRKNDVKPGASLAKEED